MRYRDRFQSVRGKKFQSPFNPVIECDTAIDSKVSAVKKFQSSFNPVIECDTAIDSKKSAVRKNFNHRSTQSSMAIPRLIPKCPRQVKISVTVQPSHRWRYYEQYQSCRRKDFHHSSFHPLIECDTEIHSKVSAVKKFQSPFNPVIDGDTASNTKVAAVKISISLRSTQLSNAIPRSILKCPR
jgi:uncharacterized protein YueI